MARSQVMLRKGELTDAPVLAQLWATELRRADRQEQVAELELVVKNATDSSEERLVVAEYDGELAGAVLLRCTTLTPLNAEPVVQALAPHVFQQFRRHGIGRALMETAVTFAEEVGATHVVAGAGASSRDANRFMARLALGPHAMLRVAPTAMVRAKLAARRPAHAPAGGGRQLTRVLAARRAARRR